MERISVQPNRKGIKFKQTYIKNLLKITRMKKFFISGVMAVAVSAVFTGCSKSTDLYDEAAVEKNQQEQKIAQLKKAYNDAFIKEFGSIAPGHTWGFERANVTSTRGEVYKTSFNGMVMPEKLNGAAKFYMDPFNASNDIVTELPDFIKSGTYILQHAAKQTNQGGTGDQHHTMAQLQAYDFSTNSWKDVENFGSACGGNNGKNVFSLVDDYNNQFTKGCTIMAGMGTPVAGQPLFKWTSTSGVECTNYIIKRVNGEYYLGLGYSNDNTTAYDAWLIKLLPATAIEPSTSRGRVFCEDLGAGGDIDFNDVVFDAEILNNGKVEITILAAGGTLPIYVAGKLVTLGSMTNTGVNNTNNTQKISLKKNEASNLGITSVADIPVSVEIDGVLVPIENIDGNAPGKIFTFINVPWAKEFTSIQKAYPNFKDYVNHATPIDWFLDEDENYTYQK